MLVACLEPGARCVSFVCANQISQGECDNAIFGLAPGMASRCALEANAQPNLAGLFTHSPQSINQTYANLQPSNAQSRAKLGWHSRVYSVIPLLCSDARLGHPALGPN